jgi:hypothetical protein
VLDLRIDEPLASESAYHEGAEKASAFGDGWPGGGRRCGRESKDEEKDRYAWPDR